MSITISISSAGHFSKSLALGNSDLAGLVIEIGHGNSLTFQGLRNVGQVNICEHHCACHYPAQPIFQLSATEIL